MFLRQRADLSDLPLLGNRRVLCGLNVAVDAWAGCLLLVAILVGATCFLTTVPFHPSLLLLHGDTFAVVYAGLVVVLSALCVMFLAVTVLCDPGFVLPARWAARRPDTLQAMEKEFDPQLDVHFCPVCLLFLRRYDHHCAVLGACVGQRNLWAFVLLCTTVTAVCGLSFLGIVALAVQTVQLPSAVPSVEHIHGLLTFEVVKVLVALGVAVVAGGSNGMYAAVYWAHILNDQHAHAKRRRAYDATLDDHGLPTRRPTRWVPSWVPQRPDWRAVREVLVECRGMQLTQTALDAALAMMERALPGEV